ncbi:MAG: Hsp20/alpha crystallin family protein [archaeon]|jgi:HSP20 family protein|nr:Hsp20/alpha crystallin family protein [archaeon]MDD2477511.1 Hsp20/alpha crystallin family protein [Candidatus ainarchaeum sp.]MDD3084810.1 Hsp20/alpha crystallin family protein [Candidatus ainarchaeum sp.]MDD4221374.1 Hsp20/alpha crystallin family protein [Candidatus ainarchaeum sp.]MDD4662386.1 Hsp20/alpha crystallin family protein [Candidatus ainarchaeum sp.]
MKRYTIWDEMRRMQRDMDSLFEDFVYSKNPYLLVDSKNKNELETKENYREPVCNIEEDKENYNFSLEIPGSKKEDIKININDNILEIEVEHKKEEKKDDEKKGSYSYSRSYSGFYRSFSLPRNIDKDNVDAEYKDGVLKIKIPKKEISSSQKQIEVK